MKFISFDANKCDECFKCLRACPTKAIAFTNKSHHIIDERCIKCGLCQLHCPEGALSIELDLNHVQRLIKKNKKVIASLAPSFAGAFNMSNPHQMSTALRELGFFAVEETARGAEMISKSYEKIIESGKQDNIITSCCPSSNYLIEHYYSNAVNAVIQYVSPMLAHGHDIKERYGNDVFVVFIGPCLAKKAEAVEMPGSIDAVITFRELEKWLDEEAIILDQLELSAFDTPVTERGRAYPLGGSLWREDLKTRINPQYEYIHVDGIENCHEFLKAVENDEIHGYCAELNICSGSCLNGPNLPANTPNQFKRMQLVKQHVSDLSKTIPDQKDPISFNMENDDHLKRKFTSKPIDTQGINENEVAAILVKMGKYTEQDQLNCNACGYSTCYDKAIAVTLGHSDINMCLDSLRKKAEGLQSIIFESSPNAICILDSEQRIQEVNPAFHRLFNASQIKLTYWPIAALIEDKIFDEIIESQESTMSKKIYIESLDRTFFFNIVRVNEGKTYVGIFTDITQEEFNRQELAKVKAETLKTCQEVIDHQMRVAQEIASLLGETTAETKIGLNKLKGLVLSDGGESFE